MILRHLLLPDILELVEANRLNEVRDFLAKQPAPEITDLLAALDDKDALLIFRVLPRTLADEVFSLLEPNLQNWMLKNMAQEEVRYVLKGLTPDDRTALFEELPARVVKGLLTLLNDKDRKLALTLLGYPEGSVGRLMTDRYVTVNPDWTVTQTLDHLRAAGMDSETMTMIYITDAEGHLVDDLRLRRLILAAPMTRVRDLLDGHYASLTSLQDREEAVGIFQDYDLFALPVVDADGVLLGIVTIDDILDVAEEEATEDFHKMASVRPLQTSLKDATIRLLVHKRIGWLLALVGVNIFTGMGLSIFEETIQKVVALVFFMPLLIGSGGNAGSQAATLLVRAIATGDVESGDWWRIFFREIAVSVSIGAIMSAAVFFLGWWLGHSLGVGVVVAASMFALVIMGSLLGTTLPMLLDRLHLDPATAAPPLITSVADILGILIYFSIATLFFRWLPIG
ncbi:MAG: magnesium transporter [Kiritimatiellae bacterium]|nr:magnesium transporter [Kiritimatiellia bacterium]MBR4190778.1 magnesium transporter [Kiritimatiellia bacterium]MBR4252414.1 magnesium transporter [Kiritimatiellia bacterium]